MTYQLHAERQKLHVDDMADGTACNLGDEAPFCRAVVAGSTDIDSAASRHLGIGLIFLRPSW
jgi:hypothetical protein